MIPSSASAPINSLTERPPLNFSQPFQFQQSFQQVFKGKLQQILGELIKEKQQFQKNVKQKERKLEKTINEKQEVILQLLNKNCDLMIQMKSLRIQIEDLQQNLLAFETKEDEITSKLFQSHHIINEKDAIIKYLEQKCQDHGPSQKCKKTPTEGKSKLIESIEVNNSHLSFLSFAKVRQNNQIALKYQKSTNTKRLYSNKNEQNIEKEPQQYKQRQSAKIRIKTEGQKYIPSASVDFFLPEQNLLRKNHKILQSQSMMMHPSFSKLSDKTFQRFSTKLANTDKEQSKKSHLRHHTFREDNKQNYCLNEI